MHSSCATVVEIAGRTNTGCWRACWRRGGPEGDQQVQQAGCLEPSSLLRDSVCVEPSITEPMNKLTSERCQSGRLRGAALQPGPRWLLDGRDGTPASLGSCFKGPVQGHSPGQGRTRMTWQACRGDTRLWVQPMSGAGEVGRGSSEVPRGPHLASVSRHDQPKPHGCPELQDRITAPFCWGVLRPRSPTRWGTWAPLAWQCPGLQVVLMGWTELPGRRTGKQSLWSQGRGRKKEKHFNLWWNTRDVGHSRRKRRSSGRLLLIVEDMSLTWLVPAIWRGIKAQFFQSTNICWRPRTCLSLC